MDKEAAAKTAAKTATKRPYKTAARAAAARQEWSSMAELSKLRMKLSIEMYSVCYM